MVMAKYWAHSPALVRRLVVVAGLLIASVGCSPVQAPSSENNAVSEKSSRSDEIEWKHYGQDLASTKYSPASQIDKTNVHELVEAWRWESPSKAIAVASEFYRNVFSATPLMVDATLYVSTPMSQVVAIDARTGKTRWVYDPKSYEQGRPTNGGFIHRGVEYWTDGEVKRIFIATGAFDLISIDAETGQPDPAFGEGGKVDLGLNLGRPVNRRYISVNAPPVVCRGTVVVGSIVFDLPTMKEMPPGHVRGYDARTGALKWVFHTIPQAEDFGVDTWEDDSWKYSGNTNVWGLMSADEELGYVYLPVSDPTNDHYGGHRLGDNLFAGSLVCLNAETGERVWHFQTCHHPLWDYDLTSAPNLIDIEVDGKPIRAVAQLTKQAVCFVFDRATGEPVWPIDERPVPQTDVPGERTSPTQPFPTKPPAYDLRGITEDDVVDFTPAMRAEALEKLKDYVYGPVFTPPTIIVEDGDDINLGTLAMPGPGGGTNWDGGAFDPETGMLYIPSETSPTAFGLSAPDPNRSNFRYNYAMRPAPILNNGLPVLKPPYARLTAMDMNRGEIVWQIPHGNGPIDHPDLLGLHLGPLGEPSYGLSRSGGPLVTRTLLFTVRNELQTGVLRAYDKATGAVLWEHREKSKYFSAPMTYVLGGKQYIVNAVGGAHGVPAELVAMALPDSTKTSTE